MINRKRSFPDMRNKGQGKVCAPSGNISTLLLLVKILDDGNILLNYGTKAG